MSGRDAPEQRADEKDNFYGEGLRIICQGTEGKSKSKGPKRDLKASYSFSYYFCKKPWHIKKNCLKYKEMLQRKGGKDSDGVSISEKSDQAGVVKEVDENSCDVLTAESGKGRYSDAWLLDSG